MSTQSFAAVLALSALMVTSATASEEPQNKSLFPIDRDLTSLEDTYFGISVGSGRYTSRFTSSEGKKTSFSEDFNVDTLKFGVVADAGKRYEFSYSRMFRESANPGRSSEITAYDFGVLFPFQNREFELAGNPVSPYFGIGGGIFRSTVSERRGKSANISIGLRMEVESSFELSLSAIERYGVWEGQPAGSKLEDWHQSINLGFVIKY